MEEFYAKYFGKDESVSFDNLPKAYIDKYIWGNKYTPVSYAQIAFKEDSGFYINMYCFEKKPRAVYTNFDDPVYLDSCLEFFCDYLPENFDGHYINTEMNSNGAFLTYWAKGIGNYTMINSLSSSLSTVTSYKDNDGWGVHLYVPLKMLQDIYNCNAWTKGSIIRANFYKCGSDCEIPHYGTWNEIKIASPNFHKPEFFKNIIIK